MGLPPDHAPSGTCEGQLFFRPRDPHFKADAGDMSISDLMREIIEETGYIESLDAESKEEIESRVENIEELSDVIVI